MKSPRYTFEFKLSGLPFSIYEGAADDWGELGSRIENAYVGREGFTIVVTSHAEEIPWSITSCEYERFTELRTMWPMIVDVAFHLPSSSTSMPDNPVN